jgi:hypothetical protein
VLASRLHGALGAATAEQSRLAWREPFGPLPPAEALGWASTAWLLVDLLDDLVLRSLNSVGEDASSVAW